MLLFFAILILKIIFSCCSLLPSGNLTLSWCVKQNDRNESFKLIWNDEFESAELNDDEWDVSNEYTKNCSGNISCDLSRNVKTQNGLLILKTSYEKYNGNNFTGAKLTTKRYFSHGRYEIRLIQPKANLKSCIYTWDPDENYWHESGQIVLTCTQSGVFYRSVFFAKSNDSKNLETQYPDDDEVGRKWFHLYGFEWSKDEVRFFFDDKYGDPIPLKEILKPQFQLRFWIRVDKGGPAINKFADLGWDCPAFLIDYVRIYKKLTEKSEIGNLQNCLHSDNSKKYFKSEIDQICVKIGEKSFVSEPIQMSMKTDNSFYTFLKNPAILAITIVLIVFFIIYMNYQICKIKKNQRAAVKIPVNEYDYLSHYELQPSSNLRINISPPTSKAPSYLSLQEVNQNEYDSMKAPPVTNQNLLHPNLSKVLENKRNHSKSLEVVNRKLVDDRVKRYANSDTNLNNNTFVQ